MARKTIAQVREEFQAATLQALPAFVCTYETDSRAGVQKLVAQAKKQMEKMEAERARVYKMGEYERQYAQYTYVCGVDEAGRGPLAGPVVAGAVILPKDCEILYINDSKKLSADLREQLFDVIMEQAVAAGVNAGKLVKALCALTGGSGGGRPDSAMGSAKDAGKLGLVLEKAEETLLPLLG